MTDPSLHALLLLSDSALPLGSFAFSSGLESYLAHHKPVKSHPSQQQHPPTPFNDFTTYLHLSLRNQASTTLPFLLAAHANPSSTSLLALDDALDAATPCTVARRASTSQGRALLTLWHRSLAQSSLSEPASAALASFASALAAKSTDNTTPVSLLASLQSHPGPAAHFGPLFGTVCAALSLSGHATAYLYLLNHAKSLLSAGVRAGALGPYQAQALLAGADLREAIEACIVRERGKRVEDAGVCVPGVDLWGGRHELLYSRIFNS